MNSDINEFSSTLTRLQHDLMVCSTQASAALIAVLPAEQQPAALKALEELATLQRPHAAATPNHYAAESLQAAIHRAYTLLQSHPDTGLPKLRKLPSSR